MSTVSESQKLQERVARDHSNATSSKDEAQTKLSHYALQIGPVNFADGIAAHQRRQIDHGRSHIHSLQKISEQPFQAMIEVITETISRHGESLEQLWYANEHSTMNEVIECNGKKVNILAWTHPGIQLAISGSLGEVRSIKNSDLSLVSVRPKARARFSRVLPDIKGLYEPGGSVGLSESEQPKTGLKAVKLDMTKEQVNAFISRMDGMMIVTGAPGSGKTTVAYQRIRFLFDQQSERRDGGKLVPYTPEQTRVFLANPNLVAYSRLFVEQLGIPESIVSQVETFIENYLDTVWQYKHEARPRQRKLTFLEQRAFSAFYGLLKAGELSRLWRLFEDQILNRLCMTDNAEWMVILSKHGTTLQDDFIKILKQISLQVKPTDKPLGSQLRMDGIYRQVSKPYEQLRIGLTPDDKRIFDEAFMHWLYWVYDPMSALESFFSPQRSEGAARIRQGTGSRVNETQIMESIRKDWNDRQFGPAERPWLAWLLRFALPEADSDQNRFRGIPSALSNVGDKEPRWTHVVIDEVQDLSVAEASLIVSFVDPNGAVTVSADFQQVVSPVHGMVNADALFIGNPLRGGGVMQTFPFAKNMRQSHSIGLFLQAFHQAAFGERAQFDVNESFDDIKPRLYITRLADFPLRMRQLLNALSRSETVRSIALVQVNEDEEAMKRLRASLESMDVPLAPLWDSTSEGKLITSSVERIKGLEFDACIVLGIDQVERASLNFTINRAYVALSRPARRLVMVCEEFPSLLRRVNSELFEVTRF